MVNRILLALLLILSASYTHAADFTAATCNGSNDDVKVQAAINDATMAGSGNRVLIPAGTCTFEATVTTPEGIGVIIQGAGVGNTVINRGAGLPSGVDEDNAQYTFELSVTGDGISSSFTGITLHGQPGINVTLGDEEGSFFRIHHNSFTGMLGTGRPIFVNASGIIGKGLIDHNTFYGIPDAGNGTAQLVGHRNCPSGFTAQDAVMSEPVDFGSDGYIFFEDNEAFYYGQYDGGFEGYSCSRFVFRFNKLHAVGQGWHGEEGERGTQVFEIYANSFDTITFNGETTSTIQEPYTITTGVNDKLKIKSFTSGTATLPAGMISAQDVANAINATNADVVATDVGGFVHIEADVQGNPLTIQAVSTSAYSTIGLTQGQEYGAWDGRNMNARSGTGFVWQNTFSRSMVGVMQNLIYRAKTGSFANLRPGPCNGTYNLKGGGVQNFTIGGGSNKMLFSIGGVTQPEVTLTSGSRTAAQIVSDINAAAVGVTAATFQTTKIQLTPTVAGTAMYLLDIANSAYSELGLTNNMDGNLGSGSTYPALGWPCGDSPGWWFDQFGGFGGTLGVNFIKMPVYSINNIRNGSYINWSNTDPANMMAENAEYFNMVAPASFDGTVGVTQMTAAEFAAWKLLHPTCTNYTLVMVSNEGNWNDGSNPLYTGQGRAYQCQSNAWIVYWNPYDYPHPMSISGPTLSGISPDFGQRSTAATYTLTGTDLDGMTSESVSTTCTGVTPGSPTVVSDTQWTVTLTIAAGATLGACTVTAVVDGTNSNSTAFTVLAANAPALETISPGSGYRGTAPTITITGTDMSGANPSLATTCVGVTVSNLAVGGPTSLTATFTIALDASLAVCDVTLTTDDGASNSLTFQPLPIGSGPRGALIGRGGR